MKIEVSTGELVDKVTILSIKLEKIKDNKKLQHVRHEYQLLKDSMLSAGICETAAEFAQLKKVNLALWEIEDKIRIKEKNQEFDKEFIRLARSVYFENDKRAEIKKQINLKMNSCLMEEKEYVNYRNEVNKG